jgi:hypothetical protein
MRRTRSKRSASTPPYAPNTIDGTNLPMVAAPTHRQGHVVSPRPCARNRERRRQQTEVPIAKRRKDTLCLHGFHGPHHFARKDHLTKRSNAELRPIATASRWEYEAGG